MIYKSPIVQFETATTQSEAQPQNGQWNSFLFPLRIEAMHIKAASPGYEWRPTPFISFYGT